MVVPTRELMAAKMLVVARLGKSLRAVTTDIAGKPLATNEWE